MIYNDNINAPIHVKAELLARELHKNQKYGNEPYSFHLEQVTGCVHLFYKNKEDFSTVLAVAWLHDVLEDTDVDKEYIRDVFGYAVLKSVMALTKTGLEDYEYFNNLRSDRIATIVKIFDRMANMTESKGHSMSKKYKKEYGKFKCALYQKEYDEYFKRLDFIYENI